jgi:hypothetical protein
MIEWADAKKCRFGLVLKNWSGVELGKFPQRQQPTTNDEERSSRSAYLLTRPETEERLVQI